jgi:O-acetyl-ADP-ribose deacetylase (regulator of RNase III)
MRGGLIRLSPKRVTVVRGDISRVRADAIVNAANTSLLGGGGVDGALHAAAGPELLGECRRIGGCPVGEARSTGAYRLPADWVIHAVGPVWRGGRSGEERLLRSAYRSSLEEAVRLGAETVAFPAISTGAYGYPLEPAAGASVDEIVDFLEGSEMPRRVIIVCYGEDTERAFCRALKSRYNS